jgi:hypothetical protein
MTAAAWRSALSALEVRHPNGRSRAVLHVSDGHPPMLYVGLDETSCTRTGETKRDFAISTVRLTYFPGVEVAQKWFAAAWVGYLQHEALELVTLAADRDVTILDPHAEPYPKNPVNRGLREGFPLELTQDTLCRTLALVMPWMDAAALALPQEDA